MKMVSADMELMKEVVWSHPYPPALCSYCHGGLPEVPLILYRGNGSTARFCDRCVERLFKFEK